MSASNLLNFFDISWDLSHSDNGLATGILSHNSNLRLKSYGPLLINLSTSEDRLKAFKKDLLKKKHIVYMVDCSPSMHDHIYQVIETLKNVLVAVSPSDLKRDSGSEIMVSIIPFSSEAEVDFSNPMSLTASKKSMLEIVNTVDMLETCFPLSLEGSARYADYPACLSAVRDYLKDNGMRNFVHIISRSPIPNEVYSSLNVWHSPSRAVNSRLMDLAKYSNITITQIGVYQFSPSLLSPYYSITTASDSRSLKATLSQHILSVTNSTYYFHLDKYHFFRELHARYNGLEFSFLDSAHLYPQPLNNGDITNHIVSFRQNVHPNTSSSLYYTVTISDKELLKSLSTFRKSVPKNQFNGVNGQGYQHKDGSFATIALSLQRIYYTSNDQSDADPDAVDIYGVTKDGRSLGNKSVHYFARGFILRSLVLPHIARLTAERLSRIAPLVVNDTIEPSGSHIARNLYFDLIELASAFGYKKLLLAIRGSCLSEQTMYNFINTILDVTSSFYNPWTNNNRYFWHKKDLGLSSNEERDDLTDNPHPLDLFDYLLALENSKESPVVLMREVCDSYLCGISDGYSVIVPTNGKPLLPDSARRKKDSVWVSNPWRDHACDALGEVVHHALLSRTLVSSRSASSDFKVVLPEGTNDVVLDTTTRGALVITEDDPIYPSLSKIAHVELAGEAYKAHYLSSARASIRICEGRGKGKKSYILVPVFINHPVTIVKDGIIVSDLLFITDEGKELLEKHLKDHPGYPSCKKMLGSRVHLSYGCTPVMSIPRIRKYTGAELVSKLTIRRDLTRYKHTKLADYVEQTCRILEDEDPLKNLKKDWRKVNEQGLIEELARILKELKIDPVTYTFIGHDATPMADDATPMKDLNLFSVFYPIVDTGRTVPPKKVSFEDHERVNSELLNVAKTCCTEVVKTVSKKVFATLKSDTFIEDIVMGNELPSDAQDDYLCRKLDKLTSRETKSVVNALTHLELKGIVSRLETQARSLELDAGISAMATSLVSPNDKSLPVKGVTVHTGIQSKECASYIEVNCSFNSTVGENTNG